MVTKKSDPNNVSTQEQPADVDPEWHAPPFTTSLDASVPGENIISTIYQDGLKKWIAIQCNKDGSLHFGVGNTEPLARRIAALKGIDFAQEEAEKLHRPSVSDESKKHLAWKDDLRELINKQREIIDLLLLSLRGVGNDLVDRPDKLAADSDLIETVVMMIQAIGVSLNSIYQLSTNMEMTLRDCFPIARSIVETAVNIAFIMAGGKETARRAQQHALQKYYRDLIRQVEIGNLRIRLENTSSIDLASIPGLQDAIDEFTTKRGTELHRWTPESIDQRIEVIQSKYGAKVGIGFTAGPFSIYRHSSEIIHGTHFGARYFWQPALTENSARSVDAMIKYYFDHFFTIFNAAYFTVDSLITIFDVEYGMPKVRSTANILLNELRELEFIKEKLAEKE